MSALIAVGGEAPPRCRLASRLRDFDLIVAADSGLELLDDWGLEPDLIVGDMDSLSRPELLEAYLKAEVFRAPRDKDESDTEMALRILAERGEGEAVIAGGGGGRIDHFLAIRALFERDCRPASWELPGDTVSYVAAGGALELEAGKGRLISVFPLSRGARGMKSQGLKWALDGLVWGPGDFSLSNEALGGICRVEAGEDPLLLVLHH